VIVLLGVMLGVLSFAPGDPGLPYSVAPTTRELGALGDRLAHDLRADGAPARHIADVCDDAVCARRVGTERHLRRVVFSSATRHMAMIWTAQASVVDVASGRVSGPYDIGYKGDYEAIRAGLDSLAAAMLPAVRETAPARRIKK
jgi:hypothetical protein